MANLKHCQFVVCVPIESDPAWLGMKVEEVERRLKALRNPAGDALVNALTAKRPGDPQIIHFMSASVVWDGTPQARAYLVLDITGDGSQDGWLESLARWMIGRTNANNIIASLVRRAGSLLLPVFESACGIQSLRELESCLNRFTLRPRTHPFSSHFFHLALGLPFQGTPGLSVRRIKDDDAIEHIARNAVEALRDRKRDAAPLEFIEAARRALKAEGQDVSVPAADTQVGDPVRPGRNIIYAIFRLSLDSWLARIVEVAAAVAIGALMLVLFNASVETMLTKLTDRLPVVVLLGLILAVVVVQLREKETWPPAVVPAVVGAAIGIALAIFFFVPNPAAVAAGVVAASIVAWMMLIAVVLMSASLLAAVGGVLAWRLRLSETADRPEDRDPDAALVQAIMARENSYRAGGGEPIAQNHLTAVSTVKPGLLRRWVMLRLGLHLVELAVQSGSFRRGFLSNIGTIHFAQWVRIPGKKLLFFSNYDGSWESYLEDFITKASQGLTIVWSNTTDFPKTNWLAQDGATDGDRFKRWVRRQQIPTLLWYSAYPSLTAEQVRLNAKIRYGLARAESGSEAEEWLGYFTSSPRPARAIETHEIQRLVFDGMRALHDGACLPIRFPTAASAGQANAWLNEILGSVAFGEQPPHLKKALFVALSWRGLEKLGLASGSTKVAANSGSTAPPAKLCAEFPPAYVFGMDHPTRHNLLGDLNECAPGHWRWGGPDEPVDAVLLMYAAEDAGIDEMLAGEKKRALHHGLELAGRGPIMFRRLPEKGQPLSEPFGFADGISQPIIKGVDRSAKNVDPLNQVNAGEFILGYRDGRDRFPPTPQVSEVFDRDKDLPNLPPDIAEWDGESCPKEFRDLGRNGSFLVIRQLEQDVDGFRKALAKSAREVSQLLKYKRPEDCEEWIAAKMVGRWKNGSSLVRFPDERPTPEQQAEAAAKLTATLWSGAVGGLPPKPISLTELSTAVEQKLEDRPDNEFLYGRDDPQGLRCPLGAHIRRANPRDSFAPGDPTQIAITNRHRLLRRGRVYDEGVDKEKKTGLLFMCLNADLERQFEFVQQAWLGSSSFEGLRDEMDPLGSRPRKDGRFTIPTPSGPILIKDMQAYVTMRGGGYFFLPSQRALRFLSKLRPVAAAVVPARADGEDFDATG